ncbi:MULTISPECIES: hypothetical protein [unclassified Microcoleus]|uniref:hypothetical protein n=1 Tax=unclassified Microcoleus TaxID=2642155 RepID=UPI002FD13588
MSSQNNETNPISLIIIALRVIVVLPIGFFYLWIRLLIWACLVQLKLFLFISIIGIPISIMIYEWQENTLNPVLDKIFHSLLRMLGMPQTLLGE